MTFIKEKTDTLNWLGLVTRVCVLSCCLHQSPSHRSLTASNVKIPFVSSALFLRSFQSRPSHLAAGPWGSGPASWRGLAESRSGPGRGWRPSSTPRLLRTGGGPSHLPPCGHRTRTVALTYMLISPKGHGWFSSSYSSLAFDNEPSQTSPTSYVRVLEYTFWSSCFLRLNRQFWPE